jgi:hypothetical protein
MLKEPIPRGSSSGTKAFLERIRAERASKGLPEQVQDPSSLDAVATVLDNANVGRTSAA